MKQWLDNIKADAQRRTDTELMKAIDTLDGKSAMGISIKKGGITMSRRTKRIWKRILVSIKKHIQALGYLCMLCMIALGLGKLIYETGILLILDAALGVIFG